jgi:hypothetical protein
MSVKKTVSLIAFMGLMVLGCQSGSGVAPAKTSKPAVVEAKAKVEAPVAKERSAPTEKTAKAPKADSGLAWSNDFSVIAGDYACDLKRIVDKRPPDADPAAVIYELYDAARLAKLGGDDEALFDRFAAVFARKHKREWIREQYWGRLKTHIAKYTRSSADSAFVVCRSKVSGVEEKFFIKSFDGLKSNPPITVAREDGVFRVVFFTY